MYLPRLADLDHDVGIGDLFEVWKIFTTTATVPYTGRTLSRGRGVDVGDEMM